MTEWLEMKPGVTWRVVGSTAFWRGTAQALVEAGICKAHQFPGMPGNGEMMSSFNPDGTKPRQGSRIRKRTPGSITIVERGGASARYYEVRMMLQPTTRAQAAGGRAAPVTAVLPPMETQEAIDTVLDDLRKLDNSINVLAKLPAPASRVTPDSLKRIRDARTALQATLATADWEVA